MSTQCFAQVRGHVIRATRVDECGVPVPGASAVAVSKRISSITIDEVTEEGTNIRERNFGGDLCVVDDAFAEVIGYSGNIAMCGVDPDVVNIFTEQPIVEDAAGDVVGFDAKSGIDLDGFGFALEVWTKIAGSNCGVGPRPWGYTVFPFFKGGRLGGFSFENGLVTFTIQGAQTRVGNAWGVGPFDVELSAGTAPNFTAGPLFTPLASDTHFRNILVRVPPPAATCGAIALPA